MSRARPTIPRAAAAPDDRALRDRMQAAMDELFVVLALLEALVHKLEACEDKLPPDSDGLSDPGSRAFSLWALVNEKVRAALKVLGG
jgi:hypothetical protein